MHPLIPFALHPNLLPESPPLTIYRPSCFTLNPHTSSTVHSPHFSQKVSLRFPLPPLPFGSGSFLPFSSPTLCLLRFLASPPGFVCVYPHSLCTRPPFAAPRLAVLLPRPPPTLPPLLYLLPLLIGLATSHIHFLYILAQCTRSCFSPRQVAMYQYDAQLLSHHDGTLFSTVMCDSTDLAESSQPENSVYVWCPDDVIIR